MVEKREVTPQFGAKWYDSGFVLLSVVLHVIFAYFPNITIIGST